MMCVKPHGCVKPLLAGICVEGYQHVLLHPNPNSVISKQNPIGSLLENDLPDINGASNLRDLNFFGYSHLYSLDETLLSLIVLTLRATLRACMGGRPTAQGLIMIFVQSRIESRIFVLFRAHYKLTPSA